MFAWVAVFLGLCASPAIAADLGSSEATLPSYGLFAAQDPMADMKAKKEAEDKAREERLKALESAQSQVSARVVVLSWPGAPSVNYDHAGLRQNIASRIARPDAIYSPDMDLYQVGRRHPNRALSAAEQPGTVPDENIGIIMDVVRDIENVPWNGMSESDWGITANNMVVLVERLWFIDRPELRESLFLLYVQIGRAAENMNNPVAPFYQMQSGQLTNYYWYLAGAMAYEEPALLGKLTHPDLASTIEYYKGMLDRKEIEFMTLSFEQGGVWDARKFAGEYQVFINGREVVITDPNSLHKVPPGRVDIFLKRADGGFSISDRVQLDKLEGKVYFVRDVARKRMGIDLIDQLMKHPNECTPRVEGDILTDLAIYAMLHKGAEVYVAVPVAGDPTKVQIWRWNREAKTLTKVLDNTGGYPIRFAVLGGAGMQFSGLAAGEPNCTPNPIPGEPDICTPAPPQLVPAGIPFHAQLRAHYGRLMVLFGGEFSPAISEGGFIDEYQVASGHNVVGPQGEDVLKERQWNYLLYTGVGVMFMKKAAQGFGPRAYVRFGGYNVPHTFDLTAHGGLTFTPPGKEDQEDKPTRIKFLLDADGYIGMQIPYGRSIYDSPLLTFGLSVGAGLTF